MVRVPDKLTDYLVKNGTIARSEYDIYKYGFQIGLEFLLFMVINLFIAINFQLGMGFLVFLCVFTPLRLYCGGLHLNHYISCLILSTIVVFGVLIYSKINAYPLLSSWLIILMTTMLMIILNNKNSNENQKERAHFKRHLIKSITGILLLSAFFSVMHNALYMTIIANTMFIVLVFVIIRKLKETIKGNALIN